MTNKKAFLVISFGSTFEDTREKDIGGVEHAMAIAFPNYDHYRAFTSTFIRKALGKQGINVDDADEALAKLAAAGYEEVILQPTHLLNGQEFEQRVLAIKDKYIGSFKRLLISTPLLYTDHDYELFMAAVQTTLPPLAADEGVVFMGHGTPHRNNAAFGTTYVRLQQMADAAGLPYLFGTVEDEDTPNLEQLLERLKDSGYRHVHMYPMMVVAGDHANNDMYSDEEDSWKTQIETLGIRTTGHLHGMGRLPIIQSLYIQHALETLAK